MKKFIAKFVWLSVSVTHRLVMYGNWKFKWKFLLNHFSSFCHGTNILRSEKAVFMAVFVGQKGCTLAGSQ